MLGFLAVATALPSSAENGWISGTISDSMLYPWMGDPIAGATVATESGGYSAQTNATGVYNMSVPPGNYTLRISAQGFLDKTSSILTVTAGNTTRKDYYLSKPTGSLIGKVTDAEDGKAIYPAILEYGDMLIPVMTDAAGEYSFHSLPVGNYTINVSALGYQNASFTVTIAANKTVNKDVQMRICSYLTLTVRNSDGAPIGGASVKIGKVAGTTDQNGQVSLQVLAGTQTLKVTASGYRDFSRSLNVDKGTIITAEATMMRPGEQASSISLETGVIAIILLELLLPLIIIIIVVIAAVSYIRRKKKALAAAAVPPGMPGYYPPQAPPEMSGMAPPPGPPAGEAADGKEAQKIIDSTVNRMAEYQEAHLDTAVDFTAVMEKIGIARDMLKAGNNDDALDFAREADSEAVAIMGPKTPN